MPLVRKGKKPLGQYLVERGVISTDQLQAALQEQRKTGLYLREVLLKLGFAREEDILGFFEEELNIPRVNLSDYSVDQSIIELIPEKLARRYRTVPLFRIKDTLTVAMEDPLNVIAIDELGSVTGMEIDPCISTSEDMSLALRRYYGGDSELSLDGEEGTEEGKVIKFVQEMIRQAVDEKASDIHIEPDADVLRVRFRVDGVLKEVTSQPKSVHPAVASRIKVLSDLDIAEKRLPQDGRFQMKIQDRILDLRVSTFPTIHGENVVLRVLDKKSAVLRLDDLGLSLRDLEVLTSMIAKPNGMILVTGPTGSGKTSTLYAVLQKINTIDRDIATLEDPVEYILPMIRQTQINEDVGLTFAKGLRSLVRQDPDVIMVGEIRDRESAEIAVRSALTGHLVLSTVHTNDAVGAIVRLLDMGVEPFLLASSLLGIVAQRLLRRICPRCKEPYSLPGKTAAELGLSPETRFFAGKGCRRCGETGYSGRLAIFEVVEVNEALRNMVVGGADMEAIRAAARKGGTRSLREDGIDKAMKGLTTVDEVIRVTKAEYVPEQPVPVGGSRPNP